MNPGVYPGLSMSDYLAMPAVNAKIIKTIIDECPRAAWWQSWFNADLEVETSDDMDLGTVAHAILLEGSQACVQVIDFPDWRTNAAKGQRDEARSLGKIPMLARKMPAIEAMVASARDFIDSVKTTEHAIWQAFQQDGGESEVTMVWQDGSTLCKIRPDRISTDRKLIVDAKFTGTSAEPDRWGRTQMIRMGYYVGAAFYRRGIEAMCNVSPAYVFLVVQTDPPYLCSLVGVDPHGFDLGAAKVAAGLRMWQSCMASGRWPAYPTRVCYPEIPAWEDSLWQEREDQEVVRGFPYDPAQLFGGIEK